MSQTIQYLESNFRTNKKLFAASLDADNQNGEGAYYTFSEEEIEKNFSKIEKSELEEGFLMTKDRLFEEHWHLQYNKRYNSLEIEKLKD